MEFRRVLFRSECAAQGQPGELRLQLGYHVQGEVLEVDGREWFGADSVELHLVASGDAEQANLPRRAIHGHQPNRMFEGQRAGGNLGDRKSTRLNSSHLVIS